MTRSLRQLSLLQLPPSFFIPLSTLLSVGSVHPSGAVWETEDWSFVIAVIFISTPPPSSTLVSGHLPFFLFFFVTAADAARLSAESTAFIG